MSDSLGGVSRRAVLGGFATGVAVSWPHTGFALDKVSVLLEASGESLALSPGRPPSKVWRLAGRTPVVRVAQGASLDLSLTNDLAMPAALSGRGLVTPAPLLVQPAIGPGGRANLPAAAPRAGTGLLDLRLLGDGAAAPIRPLPVIVEEKNGVHVDRDEVFLVEDFRLKADGSAVAPGADAGDAEVVYTVNGQLQPDLALRALARVRLRFINGCYRAVIAIKITDLDAVRVVAIDSQPAEPFLARNGAVVLPPGGRTDVFIDMLAKAPLPVLLHDGAAARLIARLTLSDEPPLGGAPLPAAPPLPANGLPDKLDLRSAFRAELALDGPDWRTPAKFDALATPAAFQARAGRVVVLALVNKATTSTVVHLHGQPFRLLDRLDDGWKPYWLDTLAVEPGQTQRIAFLAEYPGRYLIEQVATDWAAPRLVRWYSVQ